MFYETIIKGKTFVQSDFLGGLNHYFTTRNSSLKLDDEDLAYKNKLFIAELLNISTANFIKPIQTHSANIAIASNEILEIPNTDAVILTQKNIVLTLNFADCTPVIIYDKKQNIVAGVHAGWRGTAQKIAQKTALKMINELNCSAENLIAVIGPCISKDSFEVSQDVIDGLTPTIKTPEKIYQDKGNGKFMADLKTTNKLQLEEIGIKNIDICPYCTVINNDKFYSYRLEKTNCRHNLIVALK